MPYLGKKPVDFTDVTESQTFTVTEDITTPSINSGQIGGRRNLIINGAMQVAQRSTSETFQSGGGGYLTLDRFSHYTNSTAVFTSSQSTDAPDGFSNSLKLDCTTADTSVDAAHRTELTMPLEAQNLQHLNYGSSSAKTVTISLWVKSSVTGDYAVSIYQADESTRRTQSQVYTVNTADTWEHKTLTYTGDTSGLINNDNGAGVVLRFGLMAGSNFAGTVDNAWGGYTTDNTRLLAGHTANIGSSTSNEFYITGIQLEVGSTATDFEHRSFGEELALCQRYYYRIERTNSTDSNNAIGRGVASTYIGTGQQDTSTVAYVSINSPAVMRDTPSVDQSAVADIIVDDGGGTMAASAISLVSHEMIKNIFIYATVSGGTTGRANRWFLTGVGDFIELDAEL